MAFERTAAHTGKALFYRAVSGNAQSCMLLYGFFVLRKEHRL